MLVRIRLKRGPRFRRNGRKNRHVALASAALLTPAAVMAFVLSMWRLGNDIGFTRSFAIHTGIFSHWQVWLAISLVIQFSAVLLNRYGKPPAEIRKIEVGDETTEPEKVERLVDSRP